MKTRRLRKNGTDTITKVSAGGRFRPGNPGRPKGARNKTTLAVEALLDGESEAITRKAIEMALSGDTTAMRLVMDRICAPRRDRPVSFALPNLQTAADAVNASAAIAKAVASGELTPMVAGELAKLIDGFVRAFEVHEVEQRLEKLESIRRT